MKSDIHPEYHAVLFHDVSNGFEFVTRSTMTSEERRTLDDGTEAYVVRLDITANSHPFFTGEQRMVDTAGRVERFRRRYQRGADEAAPADESAATEE
ncbi:MAG: type B 50S ribosomal protein L31 [Dehalococcoidia bacterium]|nr:type B 50S ribosomal protein L31 [Dehalococcoidia bacterium]